MEYTALELIDKLIACWSDWDFILAPSIVRSDGSVWLTNNEKEIVTELRQLLSPGEWQELPMLIAQRRAKKLREVRHREDEERARREEEKEREQHEIERERKRQERERLQAEEAQIARKRALVARLKDVFESDFLSADGVLAAAPDADLVSGDEYDELKTRFVQDWAARERHPPLDSEQAAAVAATEGDVQVVARAGSGKTRTLVTRAIFLQKHCRVFPRELLLLAFNKKAAKDMKSRLAQALGENLPYVMTFHALAYALVHPEEDLLFDDASTDQLGLSREVQEVIDEHVMSEKDSVRIRELMLAHFREDWERIVDGRFQMTMDEFLAHRRSLPRESLKGDYVKSFGEKVIANALFEHGVEYRYERNFRWNEVNYRPDFTILTGLKSGVVIEYFGLKGDADYDEMSEQKRTFWAERDGWTLLEFSPTDLMSNGVDGFARILLQKLQEAGVPWERRTEEEIWELVRRRALDSFTTAMRTFVGRCRKLNLSPNDLESMVAGHTACLTAEAMFLDVGVSIYRGYLERLVAGKKEDFDGLMWRSVSLVRDGQTQFARDKGRERGDVAQLRFVMIDEFQDFSQMFFELVDAIRSANPHVQFFCVGDDWQAINTFAGSDLVFFTDFNRHFRRTSRCYLRTNYRSPESVVAIGNALMDGRGPAAEPERGDAGQVWLCKLDEFRPSVPEQARHKGDEITPAVLRLVSSFLDRGLGVVMLSRRNGVTWYVNYDDARSGMPDALVRFQEHVRSFLPEEDRGRVRVSTTHKYKGLEDSAVIVLDAVERSYPLIHPNWVFLRVFGDSIDHIEDEERRLFYVAVTRTKDSLALVTESLTESPYLGDIRRHVRLDSLSWEQLAPVPSLDSTRIEIRVFNAYNVKDQLKDLKYRWNGKYWYRAVLAEGFSFDALLGQPWAGGGVRVEVYSEMGELLYRR
ncbi:UvrD-helicase domain-containing protein [Candidatus Poribacteria bacterium]|nr:UvrD-helicase domain-containing protein [Candidatus Poribacteria bacterium]